MAKNDGFVQRDFGRVFQKLEDIDQKMDDQTQELKEIKRQTQITNGRVSVNEKSILSLKSQIDGHELLMKEKQKAKKEMQKEEKENEKYNMQKILFWIAIIQFIGFILFFFAMKFSKQLFGGG